VSCGSAQCQLDATGYYCPGAGESPPINQCVDAADCPPPKECTYKTCYDIDGDGIKDCAPCEVCVPQNKACPTDDCSQSHGDCWHYECDPDIPCSCTLKVNNCENCVEFDYCPHDCKVEIQICKLNDCVCQNTGFLACFTECKDNLTCGAVECGEELECCLAPPRPQGKGDYCCSGSKGYACCGENQICSDGECICEEDCPEVCGSECCGPEDNCDGVFCCAGVECCQRGENCLIRDESKGDAECCEEEDTCGKWCCGKYGMVCENPDAETFGEACVCPEGTFLCQSYRNEIQCCKSGEEICTPVDGCCAEDKVCGAICCGPEETCVSENNCQPSDDRKGVVDKVIIEKGFEGASFGIYARGTTVSGVKIFAKINGRKIIESTNPITTAWHHIILTYSNGYINLYIDGKKAAESVEYGLPILSNNENLILAKKFQDVIDEVKIYSKGFNQCEAIAHNQRRKYAGGEICEVVNSSIGCLNYQGQYGAGAICEEPYIYSIDVETYGLAP